MLIQEKPSEEEEALAEEEDEEIIPPSPALVKLVKANVSNLITKQQAEVVARVKRLKAEDAQRLEEERQEQERTERAALFLAGFTKAYNTAWTNALALSRTKFSFAVACHPELYEYQVFQVIDQLDGQFKERGHTVTVDNFAVCSQFRVVPRV
jgi:hypothetical protein